MDSDCDSDFYGDEETTSALSTRVANFDIVSWWARHRPLPTTTHQHQPPPSTTPLHNPYEHLPTARQLTESIPSFLARLPPATTDWRPGHDWIWIANPYHTRSPPQSLTHFRQGGASRLALLTTFLQTPHPPATAAKLARDLAHARREAVADLTELAGACGVVAGKWMLFPSPGDVNEVWAKVAHATAEGSLGVSAKVETKVDAAKARLVCVYTRDWRDKGDVARVLKRLGELELVRPSGGGPGGRQIYYKCDAWTELGIYGGNEWGIGASMYSSNEIFGYLKTMASGGS